MLARIIPLGKLETIEMIKMVVPRIRTPEVSGSAKTSASHMPKTGEYSKQIEMIEAY